MKRLVTYLLIVCVLTTTFGSFASFAAKRAEIDQTIALIPTENWPEAPQISSEAGILVERNTGVILYAKNATQKMYPASTTKLMTALLTLENCNLNDVHEFTAAEVNTLPAGSSHIGMRPGESLTIRDCLYGLLLPSANEVANGLAVEVAGSTEAFVDMMNEKAQELGCVNTHFANPNGLHDENHYTCAYDLYLILQACLAYSNFIEIASTPSYYRQADELLDKNIPMTNTHYMVRSDTEYYYANAVCGKTGWTQEAGRCLATYATNDSSELICVTMKTEAPQQFIDTRTLLEYGFNEFTVVNAATRDVTYGGTNVADSLLDIPFQSIQLLQMSSDSSVLLPSTKDFTELDTELSNSGDGIYTLTYSLNQYVLGTASLFAPEAVTKNPLKQDSNETLISSPEEADFLFSVSVLSLAPIVIVLIVIALILYILLHPRIQNPLRKMRF